MDATGNMRSGGGRFRLGGTTDRGSQGLAAELLETGDEQLSIAENRCMLGAVPHGPFERHPDHRELMLVLECQDRFDGVCRTECGVHQLEAVDPSVGHVREDLVEDRVNVVPGLRCGLDQGWVPTITRCSEPAVDRDPGCTRPAVIARADAPRNWRRDKKVDLAAHTPRAAPSRSRKGEASCVV